MPVRTKFKEAVPMGESAAKRAWRKENTVIVKARLQKSTDADILQYLQGRSAAAEIKKGLRLLIEQNKKSAE